MSKHKHRIVSHSEWLKERQQHLKDEKEFTRLRDELSQKRRNLPWVKVEKDYSLESNDGKIKFGELFGDKSQLFIYHFMLGPDWEEGCKSCSFWVDGFQNTEVHLAARDISFFLVSRAPLEKINAYKERMGWKTPWVSSYQSQFNYDFGVSFTKEMLEKEVSYNYRKLNIKSDEMPGASCFIKNEEGIFHTYSTYSRGLDILNPAYNIMDLMPKGRDEDNLEFTMSWLKHRDKY